MEEDEKEVNRKTWWVMGIILLVLVIGVAGYYIWFQRQQMQEMADMFALEKESLSDDFEELSLQYEGYKFSVSNDSLVAKLETEQMKVQRLQEELKTVNSTNARRLNELKQELETLRKIMRIYVIQIDSLNTENEKLKSENKQVTQKFQQATSQAARLTKEKDALTERVQMASRLDAVNIQITPINNKGKAAKIDKAAKLMLTFIISKNITAPVGEHTIYVRLMKPDDDILTKSNYGFFKFENKDIAYSMKKPIEYDGEEQSHIMYWDIEEYLSPGTYRVQIFAAGNQIGSKSFVLGK
jgi:hypothetical protein